MREVIVFVVLALISYVLRLWIISLDTDDFKESKEVTGVITKVLQSDYGNTSYYVSFVADDGTQLEGESIYYSSTKKKYKRNDLVPIKYVIGRKGDVMVALLDDELISCNNALKVASRNLLIATVVFLIIAVIFFVKNILIQKNALKELILLIRVD